MLEIVGYDDLMIRHATYSLDEVFSVWNSGARKLTLSDGTPLKSNARLRLFRRIGTNQLQLAHGMND